MRKERKIYQLKSISLVDIGGPMRQGGGTMINYIKYFYKIENAKRYAEEEYTKGKIKYFGEPSKKFKWHEIKHSRRGFLKKWLSDDLGYVQYSIILVEMEDTP